MKQALIAFFFLLPISTMAANVLVEYKHHPGFMPRASAMSVKFYDDGKVEREIFPRGGELPSHKTIVAKLSLEFVEKIIDSLRIVDENAQLIDLDNGKPRCMDAPSTSIEILTQGKMKTSYRYASCHTWKLRDLNVEEINDFVNSFARVLR